jgi:hypothetical protein
MDDSTWRNKEQGINNYSPIFFKINCQCQNSLKDQAVPP